jgi:two-component system response regulator NreC
MTISVLLVDDHEVVRHGLRALLASERDIVLVGEASSGEEALTFADSIHPDVTVVDLALPGMNGFELTRQLTAKQIGTRVLVLSMHADTPYVIEALRSGASGYVLKEAPAAEFVEGVRMEGKELHFFSSTISSDSDVIDQAIDDVLDTLLTPFGTLTKREVQVLSVVAEGLTSRSIGERLGIGTRTVETHRAHIMRKRGLRTQGDLISFAVRHDLLTDPEPDRS